MQFSQKYIDRFWSKVDKTTTPNGCWIWTAGKSGCGRGYMGIQGKMLLASRISAIIDGKDPTGLLVCHHCDNIVCVRPDHLFLGTAKDNTNDMYLKNRQAKIEETRHIGENNHFSKLTENEILEIRRDFRPGKKGNYKELMKKYNVSNPHIYDIVNRKTWTHI